MKLIGLDFETANGKSGSICSVGLALVEDGNVVETRHWLVRPHDSLRWMESVLHCGSWTHLGGCQE